MKVMFNCPSMTFIFLRKLSLIGFTKFQSMKKSAFVILLVVYNLGFSQSLVQKINPSPGIYQPKAFISDSVVYNLLAVMVEFAADKDAATYGNGKFGSHYSKDYGNRIIDPLPHDNSYFENHLKFLSNYYRKVSNGKVIINFLVLDKIVELPEVMSKYSPPAGSSDLKNLGKLFEEVWKKADSLNPGFDFSKYDVFTIFHAGVGRDINLTENFNLDKDIPSVFLNIKTLKEFFGSSYDGVSVGLSSFKIKNSMIIPETESREVFSFTGTALLELSINGLMAASFASYIGLPDLFDTETGLTAIGRFGLMDGQAMFNYGGLFPPEPSAWEKWYLGWIKFDEYDLSQNGISVLTSLSSSDRKKTAIKIPVNPSEYFLVENRQRDAAGNGIKIKTVIDGSIIEKIFPKDTTGFRYYQIDSIDGVVIDVDEFDWASPGSGILIWHIDENIIASKLIDNKINADKNNRGIDLEEADGIQDIGVQFTTIFGDVVVGDGEPNDFWFKGNSAKLYKNEFSGTSLPNSNANSNAPSYIKLNNFSNNGNSMTFDLSIGSDEIKQVYKTKVADKSSNYYLLPNFLTSNRVYYSKDNFFGYYDKNLQQNIPITNQLKGKPLSFILKGIGLSEKHHFAYLEPDSLKLIFVQDSVFTVSSFSVGQKLGSNLIAVEYLVYSIPVPYGNFHLVFDDSLGNIYRFSPNDSTITRIVNGTGQIADLSFGFNSLSYVTSVKINNAHLLRSAHPVQLGNLIDNAISLPGVGDLLPTNDVKSIILYKGGEIEVFDRNGSVTNFKINSSKDVTSFSLGDIKNDGNNYIIVNAGDKILAYNNNGPLAMNFPIYHPTKKNFVGNVYLADLNSDKTPDLIVESEDGQLLCFDPLTGKLLNEFRVSLGVGSRNSSVLVNENGKLYYHTVSDSGWYQVFQLSSSEKEIHWNGLKGNFLSQNSSSFPKSNLRKQEFLSKNLVYNWPNPVYDGKTNIRYYVSEDAKINIRIFDLAGDFITELNNSAKGGIESETVWDVSNVQSGIYLARVEAVAGIKKDFAIIKIAVIK